jgi:arsenate reductase (thioredoxin)
MKRVLFVCIKNTSRSVMAEALVRQLGVPGWEAHSAGIQPGTEVNPMAKKVMAERGVDLEGHDPCHVSKHHHLKFDLVAKMDAPDISDFVQAKWIENWDVPDPANGGVEEFRKVRDILEKFIAERIVPARPK